MKRGLLEVRGFGAAPSWLAVGVAAWPLFSGCTPIKGALPEIFGPPKIRVAEVRIPRVGELPGMIGRVRFQRVRSGETLLDVARAAGLGYQQLQDANPALDAWVPRPETQLVVPSRWILPRSSYRGVVINIAEMRLYLFPARARPGRTVEVRTWPIGIGTDETPSPVGPFRIVTKEENPSWIVPKSILRTMEHPRPVIPPGPDNPLGQYRMRLSYDSYEIHGTDTPWAIGRLSTHGCIRLYPEDISELYRIVPIGTPGELIYQPVKVGEENGQVYVEVHPDVYGKMPDLERHALEEVRRAGVAARVDRRLLGGAVRQKSGVPTNVTRAVTTVSAEAASP